MHQLRLQIDRWNLVTKKLGPKLNSHTISQIHLTRLDPTQKSYLFESKSDKSAVMAAKVGNKTVIVVSKPKKVLNIPNIGSCWLILNSGNFLHIYFQLTRPNYMTKIIYLSMEKLTLCIFFLELVCAKL